MKDRIPLLERKSPWRGALELLSGAYPAFAFGGPLGASLPVFHFHSVTPAYLTPYLDHLVANGYRTVTSEAVADWVLRGRHPGDRAVVLCFDDAWASVWSVAAPLLRRRGLSAITFAIPGRTADAASLRPTLDDPSGPLAGADESPVPFCTWPELRALHAGGVVDVQSHTHAHAKIFCADRLEGFVAPDYAPHLHDRPCLRAGRAPAFLSAAQAGHPLYPLRSRMSDALRYEDPAAAARVRARVEREGGPAFFARPDWEAVLRRAAGEPGGRFETEAERDAAIREDLATAREELNGRLRTDTVRHVCFPWAVAGASAERAARETGYVTAWSDRLGGRHAVRAGDPPFRLMRLKHPFIFSLPGRGRRFFSSRAPAFR